MSTVSVVTNTVLMTVLAVCGLVMLPVSAFGQGNQTESLTITTYYPSPNGVYKTLRLYPGSQPSASGPEGTLFYNATDKQIYVHNGTAWTPGLGTGNMSELLCQPAGFDYVTICGPAIKPTDNPCPIFKDCDGDGFTFISGDCDESCSGCYPGKPAMPASNDGRDNNCDGRFDETVVCVTPYVWNLCGACKAGDCDWNAQCNQICTEKGWVSGSLHSHTSCQSRGTVSSCGVSGGNGDFFGCDSCSYRYLRCSCQGKG